MRFTDEQRQFAQAIRDFCARECGTREQREALTDGGREHTSPELVAKFAELGWLGVSVPEEYGGAGAGMVEECIFLEETCRGHAPIHGYSTALTAGQTYMRWGTPEQNREVMGGYGYAVEYGMEEQVRQALVPPIYGGTNEIQREIISKNLGL